MSETSLHPPWKNVAHAIADEGRYTYGDLIPYSELYDLLGIPEPASDSTAAGYKDWTLRKMQQVEELRRYMLTEHQMMLSTETGIGLRILLPREQSGAAEVAARGEISRALRDLGSRLANVNRALLTPEELRANTDAQVRLASKLQALRKIDRVARLTEVPKITREAS